MSKEAPQYDLHQIVEMMHVISTMNAQLIRQENKGLRPLTPLELRQAQTLANLGERSSQTGSVRLSLAQEGWSFRFDDEDDIIFSRETITEGSTPVATPKNRGDFDDTDQFDHSEEAPRNPEKITETFVTKSGLLVILRGHVAHITREMKAALPTDDDVTPLQVVASAPIDLNEQEDTGVANHDRAVSTIVIDPQTGEAVSGFSEQDFQAIEQLMTFLLSISAPQLFRPIELSIELSDDTRPPVDDGEDLTDDYSAEKYNLPIDED